MSLSLLSRIRKLIRFLQKKISTASSGRRQAISFTPRDDETSLLDAHPGYVLCEHLSNASDVHTGASTRFDVARWVTCRDKGRTQSVLQAAQASHGQVGTSISQESEYQLCTHSKLISTGSVMAFGAEGSSRDNFGAGTPTSIFLNRMISTSNTVNPRGDLEESYTDLKSMYSEGDDTSINATRPNPSKLYHGFNGKINQFSRSSSPMKPRETGACFNKRAPTVVTKNSNPDSMDMHNYYNLNNSFGLIGNNPLASIEVQSPIDRSRGNQRDPSNGINAGRPGCTSSAVVQQPVNRTERIRVYEGTEGDVASHQSGGGQREFRQ